MELEIPYLYFAADERGACTEVGRAAQTVRHMLRPLLTHCPVSQVAVVLSLPFVAGWSALTLPVRHHDVEMHVRLSDALLASVQTSPSVPNHTERGTNHGLCQQKDLAISKLLELGILVPAGQMHTGLYTNVT